MDRPFLVGKKIYLRPLDIEDVAGDYLQWVNDGSVVIGKIEVYAPITKEKQQEFVRGVLASDKNVFFAVMEKKTNRFIGTAKMGPINWVHRFTEHAIMIGDKRSWNKGYGGEIIQLLLDYGFRVLNMHKIYAGASSANPASVRKNERIGYKVEAVFKEKLFSKGKYVDQIMMSISQDEFFKLYPEPIMQFSAPGRAGIRRRGR